MLCPQEQRPPGLRDLQAESVSTATVWGDSTEGAQEPKAASTPREGKGSSLVRVLGRKSPRAQTTRDGELTRDGHGELRGAPALPSPSPPPGLFHWVGMVLGVGLLRMGQGTTCPSFCTLPCCSLGQVRGHKR